MVLFKKNNASETVNPKEKKMRAPLKFVLMTVLCISILIAHVLVSLLAMAAKALYAMLTSLDERIRRAGASYTGSVKDKMERYQDTQAAQEAA